MNKYILTLLISTLSVIGVYSQPKTSIADASKAGIMKTLYHNYDIKNKASKWFCTDGALLKTFSVPTPTQFTAKILYADSLLNGANKQLYIVISLKPLLDETCHGCAPVLKFLAFNKSGPAWVLEHQNITGQLGSYGEAPAFKVQKIGKSIGFVFDSGFTNMGEAMNYTVIYAYYKGLFKEVLSVEQAYSNDGNCDVKMPNSCYSYDGKIRFLETGKEFNDIVFTKKGTDKPRDKVVKIDSVITYRFMGGKYIKVK